MDVHNIYRIFIVHFVHEKCRDSKVFLMVKYNVNAGPKDMVTL